MSYNPETKGMLTRKQDLETNNLEFLKNREYYLFPKKMSPNKETFQKVGFVFVKSEYKNKIKVFLPEKWTMREENGVLRYFYDEKNRLRGEVLREYKSLYCKFKGEMCLRRRFNPSYIYKSKNDVNSTVIVFIEDADGKIILKIGECRSAFDCKEFDKLMEKAKEYLDRKYPDWENPINYWD